MKRLLLFRHGKSDWHAEYESDHNRPLKDRGIHAAKAMGRWLRDIQQAPDRILSSSAIRARHTAELAVQAGSWPAQVEVLEALYETTAEEVLALVQAQAHSTQSLMLVGHQPTWSELASRFIGGGFITVPTAAILSIDFAVDDWSEVHFGEGNLRWLMPPRLLPKSSD
ncbi:MAG: histidine phosphatase family protein [Planctomycetota bacterium]|nr:MAG: histidine phosphatase family protein [Planctomycetota bacterium]